MAIRRRRDPMFMMLLIQLGQQLSQLERKPPVTIALMITNFALFFEDLLPPMWRRLMPSIRADCLQPARILQRGEWRRLVLSAFLHADEAHIYYNMSSLLWKGVQLEGRMGSLRFAALVAELLLVGHSLVVGASWLLAAVIDEYWYVYQSTCAVGFSAVLFGLKVVLNYNSPGTSEVMGLMLPTKYICWAELLLASLFNPQASFLGHLCGILAGLVHIHVTLPTIRWTVRLVQRGNRRQRRGQRSGSRVGGGAGGSASGAPPPARSRQAGGGAADAAHGRTMSEEELRIRRLMRFGQAS